LCISKKSYQNQTKYLFSKNDASNFITLLQRVKKLNLSILTANYCGFISKTEKELMFLLSKSFILTIMIKFVF